MRLCGRISALLVAALAVAGMPLASTATQSPVGTWKMENGKVTVRVSNCGPNLCADIVGLRKPLDKLGKPKVDDDNPDPNLRKRPVIGLRIINAMVPTGANKWTGDIYRYDNGKTYPATARIDGDKFVVQACVFIVCQKIKFDRVE
jgi:uncharacterized protein (DUF2147 family)